MPAQVQGRSNAEDIVRSFEQSKMVNCRHYPMVFIPGISSIRGEPQSQEENDKTYEESQKQRGLERKLRKEKLDLSIMQAQGAPEDAIKAQREKVRAASAEIDDFCDATGRARRRSREYVPVNPSFPDPETMPGSPADVKKQMQQHYDRQATPLQEMTPAEEFRRLQESAEPKAPALAQAAPEPAAPTAPPEVPAPDATNIFGEDIVFSSKLDAPKWDEPKEVIRRLATEYKTKLKEVVPGAHQAAGDVQISGTLMHLSASDVGTAVHEFAHTISMENQTKFGLYDEGDFWKEIRSIRTAYRKFLRSNNDNPSLWISHYEHSNKSIDEFMAEGFALGYMREKGMKVPDRYDGDTIFSARVLDAVKRYFGK